MPEFDWRTEDRGQWDDTPLVVHRDGSAPPRWLKWIPLLLVIFVGLWFGYFQVDQWFDTAVLQAQTPPLATFDLWQEAIARQDEEIFSYLLYDYYEIWAANQIVLFRQQGYFDRSALGLQLVSDQPQAVAVELSTDFNEAAISYQLRYKDGFSETVSLEQTTFLRYRRGRWQLAPPPADYWGEWLVAEHPYLTLVYPERDAQWGSRLALDLNQQIQQLCLTLAELACPEDIHLVLRLKKTTPFLIQMNDEEALFNGGQELNLPAPSLLGLPQDEAGYQALLRGYARLLATAVITGQVAWKCCQHALFYQALLAKQLQRLHLQPQTGPDGRNEQLLNHYFNIGEVNALWAQHALTEGSASDRWLVTSFIDFLVEEAGETAIGQMQRQLSQAPTFRSWAAQFVADSLQTDFALRLAWMRFATQQVEAKQAELPIPLPRDVKLLCASQEGVFRYDLAADNWVKAYDVNTEVHALLTPLPQDEGVILYDQRVAQDQDLKWKVLWPDGRETTLPLAEEAAFRPVYKEPHLPGQQVALVVGTGSTETSTLRLLDMDHCAESRCDLTPLPALPVWSAAGTHSLLTTVEQRVFSLTLADAQGRPLRPLGPGLAPFWLDTNMFGTVVDGNKIVLMSVRHDERELLLTVPDLINVLPTGQRPSSLMIRKAYASPENPDLIFIDVVAPDQRQYIFSYDRQTRKALLRLQLDGAHKMMDFRLSPDGRYWTLNTRNEENIIGTDWGLYLHDVARNQTQKLAFNPVSYATYSYEWSADGRWLLKTDTTFITLLAPDYDFQKLIFYEEPTCMTAVWVQGW